MALPDKDFATLAQDDVTTVHCDFCNKTYYFKWEELNAMKAAKTRKTLDYTNRCLYNGFVDKLAKKFGGK